MYEVLLSILLLCFHAGTLVLSYQIFSSAGYRLSHFSVPMLLYISYLIFSFLGLPGMYFGFFSTEPGYTYSSSLIFYMWILSGLCLLLLTAGYFFASRIMNLTPTFMVDSGERKYPLLPPLIVLVVCIGAFVLYVRMLPAVPLLEIVARGDNESARIARSLATNAFQGRKLHYYSNLYEYVLPFVSFYLVAIAYQRKDTLSRISAFVAVLASVIIAVFSTAKAPLLDYFIGLAGVTVLLSHKGRISLKAQFRIISTLVILAFVIVFIFVYKGSSANVHDTLNTTVERVSVGQLKSLYWTMALIINRTGFLGGSTFPNPMGIFPWQSVPLNRTVALYYLEKTGNPASKITGSAPAVFWAEVYANFGPLAALFSAFVLGVLIVWIQYLLSRGTLTPLRAALIASLAVYLALLGRLGISLLVPIPLTLMTILAAALFIQVSTRMLRLGSSLLAFQSPTKSASKPKFV